MSNTDNEKEEVYNYIEQNIADTILHKRWNRESLNDHLKDIYDIGPVEDIDESGCVVDYAFIVPIYPDWGYIDIYPGNV